jgi:hypothetical protein
VTEAVFQSALLIIKKEHLSVIVSTSSMSTNFELRQTKFKKDIRLGDGRKVLGSGLVYL